MVLSIILSLGGWDVDDDGDGGKERQMSTQFSFYWLGFVAKSTTNSPKDALLPSEMVGGDTLEWKREPDYWGQQHHHHHTLY